MFDHSDQVAVYYATIVVGATLLITGLPLFVRRRHTYPIKGRHVPIVTFLSVVQTVQVYFAGISYVPDPPHTCSWPSALTLSLVIAGLNLIVIRTFRLWFLISVGNEQLALKTKDLQCGHDASREVEKRFQKFTRYRYLITNRWLFGLFFLVTSIQLTAQLATFGVALNAEQPELTDHFCTAIESSRRIMNTSVAVMFVALSVLVYLLLGKNDNFKIRTEIYVQLAVSIILTALNAPFRDVGMPKYLWSWPFTQLSVSFPLWFPVYLSYRAQKGTRRHAPSTSTSVAESVEGVRLSQFLLDEDFEEARQSFKEFLVREFSVESLLFFRATLEFEEAENLSDEEANAVPLQLYLDYLAPGSPLEINIPHESRHSVEKHLAECFEGFDKLKRVHSGAIAFPGAARRSLSIHAAPEHSEASNTNIALNVGAMRFEMPRALASVRRDVFEDARKEIVKLMEDDPFRRWRWENKRLSQMP